MRRRVSILVMAALAGAAASCADRPLDYEQDWTEEVERICTEYCDIYMLCAPEPWFETHEECMESERGCLGASVMYWNNECGEAARATYQCTADAITCDEYDKATDIWADDWSCKAANEQFRALKCGLEDPP